MENLNNRELLSFLDVECGYKCKCSECYIHDQCKRNIDAMQNSIMQSMAEKYPIDCVLRHKEDRDVQTVTGYMYNWGEYFILMAFDKVLYTRVSECYEVVE